LTCSGKGITNYVALVKRSVEKNAGDGRQRPSHHYQLSAPGACAWSPAPAGPATTDAFRDQATGVQRDDRFAEASLRRKPRVGLLLRSERARPLPRQSLQPAWRNGGGLPSDSFRDQIIQPAGTSGGREQVVR